jgi:hypothetical protein
MTRQHNDYTEIPTSEVHAFMVGLTEEIRLWTGTRLSMLNPTLRND